MRRRKWRLQHSEVVELVVDAAGKVRSAKIINGTDNPLVEAIRGMAIHSRIPQRKPCCMPFQAQRVGSEIDAHYTNAAVLGVSPAIEK